jgi:hypothetical protein
VKGHHHADQVYQRLRACGDPIAEYFGYLEEGISVEERTEKSREVRTSSREKERNRERRARPARQRRGGREGGKERRRQGTHDISDSYQDRERYWHHAKLSRGSQGLMREELQVEQNGEGEREGRRKERRTMNDTFGCSKKHKSNEEEEDQGAKSHPQSTPSHAAKKKKKQNTHTHYQQKHIHLSGSACPSSS